MESKLIKENAFTLVQPDDSKLLPELLSGGEKAIFGEIRIPCQLMNKYGRSPLFTFYLIGLFVVFFLNSCNWITPSSFWLSYKKKPNGLL